MLAQTTDVRALEAPRREINYINYEDKTMFSKFATAAVAATLSLAASAAMPGADDYSFEPVNPEMKKGDDVTLAVRLTNKQTGKPVSDAVIFKTRADMAPDGMAEMESPVTPLPSKEPGVYVFKTDFLLDQLCQDATEPHSSHDFGKNVIPSIIDSHNVLAYPFQDRNTGNENYWRDVGTIGAFYEANMDLRSIDPVFDLYNRQWPIRTANFHVPPAKFVFDWEWEMRRGVAYDSLISGGCIISGASVRNSILSPGVFIHSYTEILDSIVMHDVEIGRGARIRRAIIDKYVKIPEGETIGYDLDKDQERYFVSEEDIVVIAKVDPFERWHDPRYAHTFIE